MSLRHAVLGLLSTQPSTGYELTNRFDVSLANAWHASHSQIYPELARLEEAGMVEVVGEGARNSRTFGITPAGREELRRWLVETEPNRAQRNETAVRWFLVALHADAYAEMLRETAERIGAIGGHPFAPTVDLGLRTTAVMRDWLREQLAGAEA